MTMNRAWVDRRPTQAILRTGYWLTALSAVLYAPLAINYMWPYFAPGAAGLQDALTATVVNGDYAYGPGSVSAVRHADYQSHRVAMLVHTTLGGLALSLAMFQFSTKVQRRYRKVHRWLGRVYMALMTVSMLTAILFLVLTPAGEFHGGSAFDLQLWALAFGTLGSGWTAVAMIRRKNVEAHHAWMTFNISLMMTAPLLRVLWTSLGAVLAGTTLLFNLTVSTEMLAVLAPGAAAIAFVLRQPSKPSRDAEPLAMGTYAIAASALTFGMTTTWLRFARLGEGATTAVWNGHAVPLIGYATICALGAWNARRHRRFETERQWRHLFVGASFVPLAVHVAWSLVRPFYAGVEGYFAATMIAATIPITVSFGQLVHTRTRMAQHGLMPATR